MKLKVAYTVHTEQDKPYFDYLRLEMVDEGMRIAAKSPLFHHFFKKLSGGRVLPPEECNKAWRKGSYFDPGALQLDHPLGCDFLTVDPNFFNEERPNMLWLLHTGLGEGFELTVASPIALNSWEDYCHRVGEVIRDIYVRFLRKATYEATFSEVWEEEREVARG